MPVRIVQSKQNARLKDLRRALTRPGRDTHGLAGIEGPHLLEEAFRAGLRVKTIFIGGDNVGVFDPAGGALGEDVDVLMVPGDWLQSILDTQTPRAVAALVEMPDWTWAHVLRSRGSWPPLVLVLAGLQDPGNLGTVIRSAEAFGATGVVALPGTVNAWNPRAVRASAGSVFRVPLIAANEEECFTRLRESGVRVLTTAPKGLEAAHETGLAAAVAIIIGNEGSGVPEELAGRADELIAIPCPGPVESLNAAVAASILLYEASRQRSGAAGSVTLLQGGNR